MEIGKLAKQNFGQRPILRLTLCLEISTGKPNDENNLQRVPLRKSKKEGYLLAETGI